MTTATAVAAASDDRIPSPAGARKREVLTKSRSDEVKGRSAAFVYDSVAASSKLPCRQFTEEDQKYAELVPYYQKLVDRARASYEKTKKRYEDGNIFIEEFVLFDRTRLWELEQRLELAKSNQDPESPAVTIQYEARQREDERQVDIKQFQEDVTRARALLLRVQTEVKHHSDIADILESLQQKVDTAENRLKQATKESITY
jgi:hypothetical protein